MTLLKYFLTSAREWERHRTQKKQDTSLYLPLSLNCLSLKRKRHCFILLVWVEVWSLIIWLLFDLNGSVFVWVCACALEFKVCLLFGWVEVWSLIRLVWCCVCLLFEFMLEIRLEHTIWYVDICLRFGVTRDWKDTALCWSHTPLRPADFVF